MWTFCIKYKYRAWCHCGETYAQILLVIRWSPYCVHDFIPNIMHLIFCQKFSVLWRCNSTPCYVDCTQLKKKCPNPLWTTHWGEWGREEFMTFARAIYCMDQLGKLLNPKNMCPNSNIPLSLSSSSRKRCSGCNCSSSESDESFDCRYDFGMDFDFLFPWKNDKSITSF